MVKQVRDFGAFSRVDVIFARRCHSSDERRLEVEIEHEDERYAENLVAQPRQVAPGSRPPRPLGRFSSFA